MYVSELELIDFRNLESLKIGLSPGFNFFYGDNGSGKTSLLESMNVYWNGKSFRSNSLSEVCNRNGNQFLVAGKVKEGDSKIQFGVNYVSDSKKRTVKFNGDKVLKSSSLATILPTLYFSPSNNYYHSASPKERRETIYWFMFHVEHEFKLLYGNLRQALDSRNAILREIKTSHNYKGLLYAIEKNELDPYYDNQLSYWEIQLADLNAKLLALLKDSVDSINNELTCVQKLIQGEISPKKISLRCNILNHDYGVNVFKEKRNSDVRLGYTNYGFHKLDISFYSEGKKLVGLSRGEEKTLSVMFLLAIIKLVKVKTNNVLFLLDDIGAELDQNNISTILRVLEELSIQSIITCVEKKTIESLFKIIDNYKLFHVKQGSITEE